LGVAPGSLIIGSSLHLGRAQRAWNRATSADGGAIMISSLASGSDSFNAEIDNVLLSFENNTPTGAIGRFQITR